MLLRRSRWDAAERHEPIVAWTSNGYCERQHSSLVTTTDQEVLQRLCASVIQKYSRNAPLLLQVSPCCLEVLRQRSCTTD